MKYRSKLYVAMVGISLASVLSGLGIGFWDFKRLLLRTERTKALTVATTTAALINPELLKEVQGRKDLDSEAYLELKRELQKARDLNRRDFLYVGYLYTLRPNPKNPQEIIYLVDAEENPDRMSYPGEVEVQADLIHHLRKTYSLGKFVSDQHGVWMTGYAPVYDRDGTYIATVGADISVETYLHDVRSFLELFVYSIIAALIMSLIGAYFLSKSIGKALVSLHKTVLGIGQGDLETKADLHTQDEFEDLANEINNMTEGLKEREHLKMHLARYVSQPVMEKILSTGASARLEGERRKITVLFSDIRQFTFITERLAPEEVVSLLNEYFTAMIDIIFEHNGTLDKFIGDGIMVEFGAPLDDAEQELHAVRTAIAMQQKMQEFELKIGIGIHTGQAVVGNIGSDVRMDYTAVGDTVNVAARLEQMTKVVNEPILISESTYLAVKQDFSFKCLGSQALPGREDRIVIYALDKF